MREDRATFWRGFSPPYRRSPRPFVAFLGQSVINSNWEPLGPAAGDKLLLSLHPIYDVDHSSGRFIFAIGCIPAPTAERSYVLQHKPMSCSGWERDMPNRAKAAGPGGVVISGSVGSARDIVGRDKIGLDEGQLVAFLEARGIVGAAETAGKASQKTPRLREGEVMSGQSGGISNSGTIVAENVAGRNMTINHFGVSEEKLLALMVQANQKLLEEAKAVGLQTPTIIELARRLEPAVSDLDQALKELERSVEIAIGVITRGERGTNEDDFINSVLAEAAGRTKDGDFDGAAQIVDDALIELDGQQAKLLEIAKRKRLILLGTAIEQHKVRRDAVAVAERIEQLVATEHTTERPAWHPEFRAQYDEYLNDGRDKGINFSLEVAIECARRMLSEVRDLDENGESATLLGDALLTLGERDSGTAYLEEAVEVFRNALQLFNRDGRPFDWATTQNNLGTTFWRLGQRESGVTRLKEAVEAYRNALQEWTRDHYPLQWAMLQNNLGNTLSTLGRRESSNVRLEEAAGAYCNALSKYDRKRFPLQWAMLQNNLGTALQTLGRRENNTIRLKAAVGAFRNALSEYDCKRFPLDWALVQHNLGTALQTLGQCENNTASLERAIEAFRSALLERTRDRVPLLWARTQNNLGVALRALGERESGIASLKQAVEAFRNALLERTYERVPRQWAITHNDLGNALTMLGEREEGVDHLEQAVEAFHNALLVRTREQVPLLWARTQDNLGTAQWVLGMRKSGTESLKQAIKAWDGCLVIVTSLWSTDRVEDLRSRRDIARAEILRRQAG